LGNISDRPASNSANAMCRSTMKRIILILVVIGRCSTSSSAMWAWVPLDELVQDCDLIVVGTLDGVSEYSQNGMDHGQGTILIDEVIWGAASAGDSVVLKWQNRSEIACPRVEHRGNQGKKAIWLLTFEYGGVVRADHPGRFVELNKRAAVEQSRSLPSLQSSFLRSSCTGTAKTL
jgi:hypothetical protein